MLLVIIIIDQLIIEKYVQFNIYYYNLIFVEETTYFEFINVLYYFRTGAAS